MTTSEAEARIMKSVPRFFQDRALDMFRDMAVCNTQVTTVSSLRIAKDWPLRGSISFTRDADGRRVRLWLAGKKWRGVAK